MEVLISILMLRDGYTREEALEIVTECREMVASGADPEEVLHDELSLEPDYVFDLLE